MKRTALALTLFLTLFSVTFGVQAVKVAKANPTIYIKPLYCRISIQSPQNRTYNTEPILLNFTVKINREVFDSYPFFYILDGQSSVEVEEIQVIGQERISNDVPASGNISYAPYTEYSLRGQAVLSSLSDGRHNLTVFMGADWVISNQASVDPLFATVDFSVDTTSLEATSENWSEVTRFTGGGGIITTESFTCDHVEWRIRWEYEPRTENPEDPPGLEVCVYTQEYHSPWFERFSKWGTEETNGTLYIHNKNGTFHLAIICGVPSYTVIIEQDVESIPEFPSWIILPLFLIATFLALAVRKRLFRPIS